MKKLLEKAKMLRLLVKAAKPAGKFINQVKGAKKNWKTIPFWVATTGSAISLLGSLAGVIDPTLGVVLMGILSSAYQIIRGLDKTEMEGVRPVLRSSEFWLGSLAIIGVAITDMQTAGVDSQVLVTMQGIIAGTMAAAQNMGATQPSDIKELEKK